MNWGLLFEYATFNSMIAWAYLATLVMLGLGLFSMILDDDENNLTTAGGISIVLNIIFLVVLGALYVGKYYL